MGAWSEVIKDIEVELERAAEAHPNYPDDNLRRVAIMLEEAGEAVKAALDLTRLQRHPVNDEDALWCLYDECCQTAAMAIKHMLALQTEMNHAR